MTQGLLMYNYRPLAHMPRSPMTPITQHKPGLKLRVVHLRVPSLCISVNLKPEARRMIRRILILPQFPTLVTPHSSSTMSLSMMIHIFSRVLLLVVTMLESSTRPSSMRYQETQTFISLLRSMGVLHGPQCLLPIRQRMRVAHLSPLTTLPLLEVK